MFNLLKKLLTSVLPVGLLFFTLASSGFAGTPVGLYRSFAGNIDFTGTGGTLRTQPNSGNSCAVTNSDTATLSGIPVGASITAAYLYWAGSVLNFGGAEDYDVTFDGVAITADRTFTETFNFGSTYNFFSGVSDVTSIVTAKRNGSYSFADLTVYAGNPHCNSSAVLSGWSLVVIYEDPAEPLRVLNLFDGFQYFRGSSITIIPDNFSIPSSGPIDGRSGHITWEGDVENSAGLGGFNEDLRFEGVSLTDALNPNSNQFNSTINLINSSTTYGVDFDVYDVTPYLTPGATSATSTYSSGGDLVLLSAEIISVTNDPVADLAITKTHTGNFAIGSNGTFTLTATNKGPSTATGPITITDTLPAGLSYASSSGSGWTVDTSALPTVTWTHSGPLAAGNSLPAISLQVAVGAAASPSVTNTASVSSPQFDNILSDNTTSDTVTVLAPDLSTSSKTVVDLNGGDVEPGDTLRYTITLLESAGVMASNVQVTDDIPANTSGFTVTSVPGGATDNSLGNGFGANGNGYLDITSVTVPASGTVTIEFEVTVSGAAGQTIANTATVNNPNGPGATPAAPTLIISGSTLPGSGTKQLYFQAPDNQNNPTLPQDMNRLPLTAEPNPNRVRIRRQDTPRTWAMTPVLQTDLDLDPDAVVVLQMRRNNQTQNRTLRLTLGYSGAATGTLDQIDVTVPGNGAAGLSNNTTKTFAYTFNFGATTLPAGTRLELTIDNSPTGGNNRHVYIYPYSNQTNDTSRIELNAATVINVDSISFYDAAYPAGAAVTSAAPGDTVYIRADVSDPFGSYDITGANLDLTDAAGTPQVSGGAMATVFPVPAATTPNAIFEYSYTVPAFPAMGNWNVRVTATEGTEGTISDYGVASLPVVAPPQLTVVKSADVASAPPGSPINYDIVVLSNGSGPAINLELTDHLAMFTAFGLDTFAPGTPFSCTAGCVAAGITLGTPTYSNDDGATYTYNPTSSGGGAPAGFDALVTDWKLPLTGNLDPGEQITIRFQSIVR